MIRHGGLGMIALAGVGLLLASCTHTGGWQGQRVESHDSGSNATQGNTQTDVEETQEADPALVRLGAGA